MPFHVNSTNITQGFLPFLSVDSDNHFLAHKFWTSYIEIRIGFSEFDHTKNTVWESILKTFYFFCLLLFLRESFLRNKITNWHFLSFSNIFWSRSITSLYISMLSERNRILNKKIHNFKVYVNQLKKIEFLQAIENRIEKKIANIFPVNFWYFVKSPKYRFSLHEFSFGVNIASKTVFYNKIVTENLEILNKKNWCLLMMIAFLLLNLVNLPFWWPKYIKKILSPQHWLSLIPAEIKT